MSRPVRRSACLLRSTSYGAPVKTKPRQSHGRMTKGGRDNNSGRARVPARREQVYVINLVKRWIWSVLGFGKRRTVFVSVPGVKTWLKPRADS
jgi:hypothetical protein